MRAITLGSLLGLRELVLPTKLAIDDAERLLIANMAPANRSDGPSCVPFRGSKTERGRFEVTRISFYRFAAKPKIVVAFEPARHGATIRVQMRPIVTLLLPLVVILGVTLQIRAGLPAPHTIAFSLSAAIIAAISAYEVAKPLSVLRSMFPPPEMETYRSGRGAW